MTTEALTFEEILRSKERAREADARALAEGRITPEQLRAENEICAALPRVRVLLDESEPLK